jgi:hypothetical protein
MVEALTELEHPMRRDLRDLARFLESQPFIFAAFTQDEVRRAAGALK